MVRNSIRPKALLTATAIALAMSGGAWAQATSGTDKSAPTTQTAPMQPGKAMTGPALTAPPAQGEATQAEAPKAPAADEAATAKEPAATATAEQAPADQFIAAQEDGQTMISDVVGAKTVTPNGDDLGKIKDLILGDDGKVQGAVLSVGGFLGIGDKEVAVPWEAIQKGGADQPLVVSMSKDQLEAAPEFMTLADQRASQQAAAVPPPSAVPAPAPSAGGGQ